MVEFHVIAVVYKISGMILPKSGVIMNFKDIFSPFGAYGQMKIYREDKHGPCNKDDMSQSKSSYLFFFSLPDHFWRLYGVGIFILLWLVVIGPTRYSGHV